VYTKNTNLNNNNNECKNHTSLLKLTKKSNEGTGNRIMLINTADFRDNVKNFLTNRYKNINDLLRFLIQKSQYYTTTRLV